ncbi:MAG TPA: UDP-N-acetylglucosamine--N-acetylmuramyl-(pentapeptide) pyrophosphoryl-undecaprenol N-acetylglucosamine transferase [Candidatus Limnocylindrales bacterium]|nr:UDP-N-acetylglucosamine--N-acetylmuramyl-(pentapeptide) pyrophosphoryl-undecaprenol N-acetylglucosamine transferase [Candidatus Limnocylindrales bacterium]
MRYSVSGGGTGGHIYPALAVARALRDARPGGELDYIGGVRGFERRLVADHAMRGQLRYHELIVRSLRSAGLSVHTVLDPARLAATVPQAWWLLGRLRPAALFTTGGYLALPLVFAARARGVPTLVWEGNVQPGRATRAIGRFATRVAVSFPPTLEAFPGNSFVSGTPIRSFEGIDRGAARHSFGLDPGDRLLVVFGGSQAVARMNAAVVGALPQLAVDWHVLHVAGEDGMADAGAARQALPDALRSRYTAEPFLTDRMADALVAADLVVGRAGSSTCAELAAAGVPSILVPYPYAGAHQRYNARYLVDEGAAVELPDDELTAARLLAETGPLLDDDRRRAMAGAARRLGLPHAARVLADELVALAEGGPLPSTLSS